MCSMPVYTAAVMQRNAINDMRIRLDEACDDGSSQHTCSLSATSCRYCSTSADRFAFLAPIGVGPPRLRLPAGRCRRGSERSCGQPAQRTRRHATPGIRQSLKEPCDA